MTKRREPVTVEAALMRVFTLLGRHGAASAVQRKLRTLHNWSDPDTSAEISLKDALQLDRACIAAGTGEAPFRDVYLVLLDATLTAPGECLTRGSAKVAKEAGEAVAAQVLAAQPGATPDLLREAAVQTHELIAVCSRLLPSLCAPAPGRLDSS
jgi:hypothetical protein